MSKIEALAADLEKALARLREVMALPGDIGVNRDAAIKRFEFTFELSWKLMQAVLQDRRVDTSVGVKNIIRYAAQQGLISQPERWFKYFDRRNMVAHTYNEQLAAGVYEGIKGFDGLVQELVVSVNQYVRGG
jgi:nucleotidyltransferase substrate binding protein (TIGR01987 family)